MPFESPPPPPPRPNSCIPGASYSPTGLLDFPMARAWAPSRLSFGSVDSRGLANGSKDEAPPRASRKKEGNRVS